MPLALPYRLILTSSWAELELLKPGEWNACHIAKTIIILQWRLTLDDSIRLSDSTIMTVLALSGHAYTTGDYETAHQHNSGLLKLVNMRGIHTFAGNIKLLIEIIR